MKGSVTVIARDKEGRYAFFRGTKMRRFVPLPAGHVVPKGEQKLNYNGNNYLKQDAIWDDTTKDFDKLRRSKGKGVKVNKAIKKEPMKPEGILYVKLRIQPKKTNLHFVRELSFVFP
ncbi:MAG: hypothetical protein ACI9NQ_000555 [Paracoccaceae bacterium]